MYIKKTLLVSAFAVALTACGPNYDEMNYDELVKHANQEIAAAKDAKYLWRDTEKELKKAAKLKKEGKEADAKKAARKALDQALMAQKQAKDEANPRVSYN
jgi:hypothetical protein